MKVGHGNSDEMHFRQKQQLVHKLRGRWMTRVFNEQQEDSSVADTKSVEKEGNQRPKGHNCIRTLTLFEMRVREESQSYVMLQSVFVNLIIYFTGKN